MTKLYVADIKHLPDPLSCTELLQQLSAERQQRIHHLKQEKSRKQCMGAGLLLQKVLALYHMEESLVRIGQDGKPMLKGLEFNLSHSGDLIICAVSEKPVGCDVEMIRKAPRSVARRYFSHGELQYLVQCKEDDYDKAFFTLWTMKESYVKMTGEGLRLPTSEYELVLEGARDGLVRVIRNGEMQACYIREVSVSGYVISICAQDAGPVEMVKEVLW